MFQSDVIKQTKHKPKSNPKPWSSPNPSSNLSLKPSPNLVQTLAQTIN